MAQIKVGSVRIDLAMNAGKLTDGVDKADKSLDRLGNKFGITAKQAALAGAAIGAAVASAATAIGVAIGRTIDEFDKMTKLSRSIGVPIEQLSSLSLAAEQSGLTIEQLGRGFRNLARNISADSTTFRDAITALGISIQEFAGLDQQQRLLLLADKFSAVQDGSNKTAIAMRILGEEMGPRFINLLNQGRQGLTDYIEEARRLGIVIDADTGAAAERFNDNIDRLKRSFGATVRIITAEVLPALVDLSEAILTLIKNFQGLDEEQKAVQVSATGLGRFFDRLGIIISGTSDELDDYNRRLEASLRLTDSIANRAAEGRLNFPGGSGDQGPEVPSASPFRQLPDAPSLPGSEDRAAKSAAAAEAKRAEAEANRILLESERALDALRLQFASPEEERNIRLEELRKRLEGVSGALVKGSEAHRLYESAATQANARVVSAYGSMASSVAGSLSKVFSDSKAFAIAQALIETYVAFNRALANPPGPPFSYAQAAAALASGFAQVRAIQSTNKGSSGGGGGASASAGAASSGGGGGGGGQGSGQAQSFFIDIQGESVGRDSVVRLIEQINQATADGVELVVRQPA